MCVVNNQQSEIGWGLSGFFMMLFLVCLTLLGLNVPINPVTIFTGLCILVIGSTTVGFVAGLGIIAYFYLVALDKNTH
jgi:hypothetical protein